MLATELPDSLRKSMIWERSQKSKAFNAVSRGHTSTDLANLKRHPEKPCMKDEKANEDERWSKYFEQQQLEEYHSRGW
jgi:hypothetical protein